MKVRGTCADFLEHKYFGCEVCSTQGELRKSENSHGSPATVQPKTTPHLTHLINAGLPVFRLGDPQDLNRRPWSRTRFRSLLNSIEMCCSQLLLIESVARLSLKAIEVCCFCVFSPPQKRLQSRSMKREAEPANEGPDCRTRHRTAWPDAGTAAGYRLRHKQS